MSRIVDRYVIREIGRTCLGVTFVLLLILIGNQFARVLSRAAAERLTRDAVFELLWLSSLEYLTVLLPLALFFAVVMAMGRLYRDSEMTALAACGISPLQLMRPVMLIAALVAAIVAWLSFEVSPWVTFQSHRVKVEAKRQLKSAALVPGRFRSTPNGKLVFYAQKADENGVFSNVFIQRRRGDQIEVVIAETGEQRLSDDGSRRELVLHNGRRYVGQPGTLDFYLLSFVEHGIPIVLPAADEFPPEPETASTVELLLSEDISDKAELHWRLSAPISLLLLAMIAMPLSRSNSRGSQFDRMGLAILFYVVYSSLLGVGRSFIENETLPVWAGMWWVHVLVLVIAVFLLALQTGWQPFRRVLARVNRVAK